MRFPKLHIATSVVNRILNTRDDLVRNAMAMRPPEPLPEPAVPDPTAEGEALEAGLANVRPEGAEAPAVAIGAARGQSPMESLLAPQ